MIVLGGGIIGLSIAWQFARTGSANVHAVIESKTRPAATTAAAGMLAPISEAFFSNTDLLNIGIASLHLYKEFLAQLSQETRSTPSLSSEGTLLVAEDRDGLEWLKNRFEALQVTKAECHWLSAKELQEKEPCLSPCALAAVYVPIEREILTSQLCTALRIALKQRGVNILHKEVSALEDKDPWTIQFSDHTSMRGEQLAIASGAWLDRLQVKKEINKPTIVPNKGQLLIARPGKEFSLKHMVRTRHVYICPKEDGTVCLGASTEFIGHNATPTLGNMRTVLQDTWNVLPSLSEAAFIAVHTGLRPSSTTGHPIVERGNKQGLYWAVGHGRSGVLLAPWTSQQLEKQINDHHYVQHKETSN